MMPSIDNFVKSLRELIQDELRKQKSLQLFVVTGVNKDRYTAQIKSMARTVQYDDVPIMTMCAGNYRGVMCLPHVGDFVLVLFVGGTSVRPIILGNVFDQVSQTQDNVPLLEEHQFLLAPQEAGPFLTFLPDGAITMRTVGAGGDPNLGSRFSLKPDGSFKLFNKDNYGVEVDAAGNMTLRGVTINATQSPGAWP
jgi:hypothetical protein